MDMFSAPLVNNKEVQLLDCMVKVYLVLCESMELSSKVAVRSCTLTSEESSCCPISSSKFGGVSVQEINHYVGV